VKVPTNVAEQIHAIRSELAGIAIGMIAADQIRLATVALQAADAVGVLREKMADYYGDLDMPIFAAAEIAT
jgi:hypothetical protein